jgi:hypothetical protein
VRPDRARPQLTAPIEPIAERSDSHLGWWLTLLIAAVAAVALVGSFWVPPPATPAGGVSVPRPYANPLPGLNVRCNDGTYSEAGGVQGACSWHGGVDR